MFAIIKATGDRVEVYKGKFGYYYYLNSKGQQKKHKREDLTFITYF